MKLNLFPSPLGDSILITSMSKSTDNFVVFPSPLGDSILITATVVRHETELRVSVPSRGFNSHYTL